MTATLAPVWLTARAAGTGALIASSLTVTFGLLMATKTRIPGLGRIELRALHEAVAIATLALIVVHGIALLFDPVLEAGLAQLLVPFASPYAPFGVGLGQIAAYGIAALSLTYYARRTLGAKRWQKAHRAIPAFWLLGLMHGLIVGTDAWTWWFLAAVALPAGAAWLLLIDRWVTGRAERPTPRAVSPGTWPSR